jgi:CPA2 family monovalent cation:H+ antiporter-2
MSSKFILPLVENSKFGNAIAALDHDYCGLFRLWALSLRRVAVERS